MATSELINSVNKAVKTYEDITGERAVRTRQMLDSYGYIGALSKIVISPDIQTGFRILRDRGQLDLSFEAVVVQYANEFSPEAVEAARWRLKNRDVLLKREKI